VNGQADTGRHTADRQPAGSGLGAFSVCFGVCLLAAVQLLKSKTVCAQQYAQATEAREQLQERRVEEARQTAAALSAAATTLADLAIDERPYEYARHAW
jgi:galactokinase/mevalonate kinase-like predicted kinase